MINSAWFLDKSHNKAFTLLVILLTFIACIGLRDVVLISDYRIFFNEDNSQLKTFQNLQDTYSTSDNIFLVIEPPAGVYNKNTITLLHRLTVNTWQLPYVIRVDSLTNYPDALADGDNIRIGEFITDTQQITADHVAYIQSRIKNNPDLQQLLITKDRNHAAINLTLQLPGKNSKQEITNVAGELRKLIKTFETEYPDHKFYTTGIVMMNNAFFEASRHDFIVLIPIMILTVLFSAGLLLRSIRTAFVVLIVVVLSVLGALGMAGWLEIPLSAPSISAPIIMFTVIIASVIHLISYAQRKVSEGDSIDDALKKSYMRNFNPILITNITTAIGFFAMNSSESPPFRDLGNIVAFGVIISWLLSMSLLLWMLRHSKISAKPSVASYFYKKITHLADWVIQYRSHILWVFLPISLMVAMLGFNNQLNDNLVKYFHKTIEFREHTDKINNYFSGIYSIEFSIDSGRENGIFSPSYLHFSENFFNWLEKQPDTVAVMSLLHRIKNINQQLHGGDYQYYKIPDNKELSAQQFLLYEMSLPYGKDLNDQINVSKSSMKIVLRLKNMSSSKMLALEDKILSWLSVNKPKDIKISFSSPAVMFAHIGYTNIISLLKGAFLALVIISILLAIVFRSAKVGLLSVIPNLLPIGIAYGMWFIVNGQISMGLASVSAMTIGIVVDDTVHFLYQYIYGLRKNMKVEDAIRSAYNHVAPAMIISTMILSLGFFILATSAFEKNAQMGMLTAITIIIALLFDLLLLPVLLMRYFNKPPSG